MGENGKEDVQGQGRRVRGRRKRKGEIGYGKGRLNFDICPGTPSI